MSEKDLKKGATFIFTGNELTLEVSYQKNFNGEMGFNLKLNGSTLKFLKQFTSVQNNTNKLIKKHNLSPVTYN